MVTSSFAQEMKTAFETEDENGNIDVKHSSCM